MTLLQDSKLTTNVTTLPLGVIPYDHPESLLDAVEIDPDGRWIRARFVAREHVCQGRGIGQQIFPGSRLGDCFYLALSILVRQSPRSPEAARRGYVGVRARDKDFRYRRPIRPRDEVELELEVIRQRGLTIVAAGRAKVDGQLAFEAEELWLTLVEPLTGGH